MRDAPRDFRPDRRTLLRALGAAGLLGLLPGWRGGGSRSEVRTRHVVVVVHTEGMRTEDTFGTPANIPHLAAMAREGVLYPAARAAGTEPVRAVRGILSGRPAPEEAEAAPAEPDPAHPTLFEYLGRGAGLEAHQAWLVARSTRWAPVALSSQPERDGRRGPRVLAVEQLLHPPLLAWARQQRRQLALGAADEEAVAELRRRIQPPEGHLAAGLPPAGVVEALDRFLIEESAPPPAETAAPGEWDARLLRAAGHLLRAARPALIVVLLEETSVASESFERYLEVIRRTDAALGSLWSGAQEDPATAGRTALFHLPALGRNRHPEEGRLGRDPEDFWVQRIALAARGPDFRSGHVVRSRVESAAVCAAVCRLFDVEPEQAAVLGLRGLRPQR